MRSSLIIACSHLLFDRKPSLFSLNIGQILVLILGLLLALLLYQLPWDTELPYSAVWLRYFYSQHRIRFISSRSDLFFNTISLSLLLAYASRHKPWELLSGWFGNYLQVNLHRRALICPSYPKMASSLKSQLA